MGYRGKLKERQQARELRAQAWTLQEIADELGVSRSSVSVWVRDVEFEPEPRRSGRRAKRQEHHPLRRRKLAEARELLDAGRRRLERMSEDGFLVAGVALYAGEGAKTDGTVAFANSDPRFIGFFLAWLRRFFDIDESRLRLRLYLHRELDIDRANAYWATVTGIPTSQFMKPYRAVRTSSKVRRTKHEFGCPRVDYSCSRTHRAIMGLVAALLESVPLPDGVALPQEFEPLHGL